jgi:hypothetical protein
LKAVEPDIKEVLVIAQGFELGDLKKLSECEMDQFRGKALPNFKWPNDVKFRRYYRIETYEPGSHCPWSFSRWMAGENGKLRMLDSSWDSSG